MEALTTVMMNDGCVFFWQCNTSHYHSVELVVAAVAVAVADVLVTVVAAVPHVVVAVGVAIVVVLLGKGCSDAVLTIACYSNHFCC